MVGIHNTGKDNAFINIETKGFDIGVIDEGERSQWVNVRHAGHHPLPERRWYERPMGMIAIGVVIAVLGALAATLFGIKP